MKFGEQFIAQNWAGARAVFTTFKVTKAGYVYAKHEKGGVHRFKNGRTVGPWVWSIVAGDDE